MDDVMVSQVRRFNRTVTERVGALNDRYLARRHSLGEARLLWEIGPDGRDVRALRARLGLDAGHLSRLLRSLEAARLVTVGPKASDRRVRTARLTAAGRRERALLDRRSDELATSFLAPLGATQRSRLVAAMADVERLLTAGTVAVTPTDPADPQARHCVAAYVAELHRRFDTGFDPARSLPADEKQLRLPYGLLLVASLHGEPIGCAALKLHADAPAEAKRMWVDESARGLGVGRRLLAELEAHAAAHGARTVRLETNRSLVEATSLYRSAGYTEVAPFNDEPYAHHWFEKSLAQPSGRADAGGT
ncbi:MAG: bifunctional helix-turn-helix transcriptional regulator/GNAT family N-acetyltransferase [Actinomycetes bacterium]